MPRAKRAVHAKKKKKTTLRQTKGFRWGRKSKYRLAKDALRHALSYSYRDRKNRKRDFRRLWQIKINAGVHLHDLSYSQFMAGLKKAGIILDRKILADLAEHNPAIFDQIVEHVKTRITKPSPKKPAKKTTAKKTVAKNSPKK